MEPIVIDEVQTHIDRFLKQSIYLHLETSTGSYVGVGDADTLPACAYIRNGIVEFTEGKIVKNEGWYSVGLKIADGWIYAEGLTDWEVTDDGKLLLGGHDREGNLKIGLELSFEPFDCGK